MLGVQEQKQMTKLVYCFGTFTLVSVLHDADVDVAAAAAWVGRNRRFFFVLELMQWIGCGIEAILIG